MVLIIGAACTAAGATSSHPPVTFVNACTCRNNHGKDRWIAKTDPALPPADVHSVQGLTPSDIYKWPGPKVLLTRQSKRFSAENKWYAVTGRVIDLKVEADGDIHIALKDQTGNQPGIIGAEVPAKAQWCRIRKVVFGWTPTKFPFHIQSNRTLTISQPQVITVIGKAFFDIDHAPKDHSNRRNNMPGYAAWEIHPVMQLDVLK